MRLDVSVYEVLDHTFGLGRGDVLSGNIVPRLAECVGELRPLIADQGLKFPDTTLVFALTAILVELSIEAGEHSRAAALMRNCAKLIELESAIPAASEIGH